MRWLMLFTLLSAASCLSSREGPPLHEQSRVSYGDRIYLAEPIRLRVPDRSNIGICTRMTTRVETSFGTETTSTAVDALIGAGDPPFGPTDGLDLTPNDLRRPQNCFVPVDPISTGTLLVDRFEVTNDQYQFCKDSGFCLEPDPSEAEKGDVCTSDGDSFFDCPVVQVTQSQARQYCQYIGRRAPSSIEHILIRQAAWIPDASTNTRSPENFRRYPARPDTQDLTGCPDAQLETFSCGKPKVLRTTGSSPTGAASSDIVSDAVESGPTIFDLTGGLSEWSSDGFGTTGNLPWFCLTPIGRSDPADGGNGEPECPALTLDGTTFRTGCVYGYYDPDDLDPQVAQSMFDDNLGQDPDPDTDLPYGLWPVCVIGDSARFAGREGALFGGNWRDAEDSDSQDLIDLAGVFGRRLETNPDEPEDSERAQGYGIRCVDDREPGTDDDGNTFPFDSQPDGDVDAPTGPIIDIEFR